MELLVRPEALQVAGDDLDRFGEVLDQALAEFCGTADRCLPAAGKSVSEAIAATAESAAHAGVVLVGDLRRLADAMHELAAGYPALDRQLVPDAAVP